MKPRLIRPLLGALLLAALLLPLTAQQASACDVSYGYRPSITIGPSGQERPKPCSTGTSLLGAALVAAAALGGLAVAGRAAYRRGAALARSTTVDGYLDAASTPPKT